MGLWNQIRSLFIAPIEEPPPEKSAVGLSSVPSAKPAPPVAPPTGDPRPPTQDIPPLPPRVRPRILQLLRLGAYNRDEILEMVMEELELESGHRGPLKELVNQELRKRLREEAEWEGETDCDRLDRVFASLEEEQGILCMQNAGYTISDGLSDVMEARHDTEFPVEGYCFYHQQDLERVVHTGNLFLCFGSFDGDDEGGLVVGRRIVQALREAGFEVEWDGTIQQRPHVKGLPWRKRQPE